ncbi:MAG: glycosyltransferase family 4 protein [Pseudomonadales bacterium]|jgi:glycosyltransferase involved in cell wall biosynthesis|nr:glycosyltransferase family 4 protein [Pseudomonadales bacterium]
MTACSAVFAVPGDLETLTGGYLYDRRLLAALRALGRDVAHLALGASFPEPTPADSAEAAARLAAVPANCPVLIDGLALGAMDPALLKGMTAPIVALVHHPLAHESGLDAARRDRLARTERANLARAAHVVVPSSHTAALLTADYGVAPDRITIARPGTDRPPQPRVKADPPLILSVGIQVPRKGHDVLLRALARVTDRSWQAVIVGSPLDTDHAAVLARLVAELGLTDRVRLAGAVSVEALAALYGEAFLFALATRYEGYGIVFDEAMAHGLPIVTCATGAVPDTVAPGAGVLVPAEDDEAFAAALARLLDDEVMHAETAAASAAAGAALVGWDDAARRVADVFDRVAKGG